MKTCQHKRFGPVEALELGFAPVGKPMMTVHLYRIGDFLIDTCQRYMQRRVLAFLEAGASVPRAVCLTHHHEDHSANAAAICRRFDSNNRDRMITINTLVLEWYGC